MPLRNVVTVLVLLGSISACTVKVESDEEAAGASSVAGSPSSNGGAAGGNPEVGGSTVAAGTSSGGAAPVLPKSVNVTLIDAVIRPWASDGKTWDGTDAIPEGTVTAVSEAFGVAAPYAAVAEVLAGLANDAYAPPDPKGDAAVVFNGLYDPKYDQALAVQMDTFQPSWNTMHIIWPNVPLDGTARLQVNLTDQDLANDDMIGTVELNNDDLIAALQAKKAYPLKTAADVMVDPILFVRISVSAADSP